MSERDCNDCDCYMYCSLESCINDLDMDENDYRNQEIVEGLK